MFKTSNERKRWTTSLSVALLLKARMAGFNNGDNGLVLVAKNSGLWGLPGGGLEANETHYQTLWREINEEMGYEQERISLLSQTPNVVTIPHESYTSVGLIFEGKLNGRIPVRGFKPLSDEISLVKPFSFKQLLRLRDHPEKVYKPEFNLYMINYWLRGFLEEKYGGVGILEYRLKDLLGD